MKSWPNSNQNWGKIQRKSHQILYYPLLKIERKSMKSHNKFIKNQWNLCPKLRENHWKLTIIWPHFDLKLTPKWYKNKNAVRPLRGHDLTRKHAQVIQKFWCCKSLEGSFPRIKSKNVGRLSTMQHDNLYI